ncbi:MAG: heavy-metal-associated domain-containing protein [Clostridium baratii]|uniref:Heavy-metal-associated domain protein n=1 Tax=Clostridium baratii str. Sullivan TaxID=1415775 RepID=A0A0A7FVI1_9CLOT|nr:heavy metal-associated domain-containing protein [Clostridium baratii]AIY83644.1 heavy-metal-associated domain protein [Clostridium baratii str. Sullivan]MBS6005429.1 heavy-metal-associated domain-containing protein [Clostridium baratii]MDU1052495.1 heavy metal-associated domain-containing protein [Clostridium baratii]MDU4909985.1 heavy metal-associated domain-containing protein [Clostridium baratii]CUP35777.1 heavy metal transport/detoxification protein [Clostridium baratii]
MNREHYIVNGLVNETVKTQMKNSLEKIDGVNNVCIDLGRGSVEVIYSDPATKSEIENCIEKTGHDIEG